MTEETDARLIRTESVRVTLTPLEKSILDETVEREGLTLSEVIGHLLIVYENNRQTQTWKAWEIPPKIPFVESPQPDLPTGKERRRGGY